MKKLSGGGDTALKEMIDISSILGTELIELLWIPRNKAPYPYTVEVIGYKVPIMDRNINMFEDKLPESNWIDGTLKFYPDDAGRCWGYVYDIPENRELLASSLANGWFKIIDGKIKEEIVEYATIKGYKTEPYPDTIHLVKRSMDEKKAEETIKNLTKKELELKDKLFALEEELKRAKGEKATQINKRLRGIPREQVEEAVENVN